MEAVLHAFWCVVECPNCHKPQVVNKFIHKGEIWNLEAVRPLECDLCGEQYEFRLQVRGSAGDPHLAPASPVIEKQND